MRFLFQILLLLIGTVAFSQTETELDVNNPKAIFTQANQYYQNADYAKALTAYNTLIALGKTSCDLHYNLGNTYFRLDSLGKSILHYEKALKINPSHAGSLENLDFAQDYITQKAGVWPDIFYKKWLRNIVGLTSAFVWWLLAVVVIWASLFLGRKYLFASTKKAQKQTFMGAMALFAVSVLFIIFGLSRYFWQADDSYAIVTTELLQVKNGPSENSKDMLKISEGNKLQIVDTTAEGWCKIQLPDGQLGWLNQKDLERI